MLDAQIKSKILATHDYAEVDQYNVDPLFTIVKYILNRANDVVQTFVSHKKLENLPEAEPSTPSLGLPLCTLKRLYCEMACKPLGEETVRETTMSILKTLSKHSWHVKALLTLAAFAVDYGDFWFLAFLYPSDKSAKSVGILKGIPNIHTESWFQKHNGEITELNKLINATLDVIEYIIKVEGLAVKYAEEELPELTEAQENTPFYVYYVIETVAACTTQMCCLFNDKGHEELSSFNKNIKSADGKLKFAIHQTEILIEEKEAYQKLVKNIKSPWKIAVVFKEMHFTPLLIGSTNSEVGIEEIESKNINVFLFISDLDICENDISILKLGFDHMGKNDQYKIIWIPIVEEWMQSKFENLRSKIPSTWYLLQNFKFKLGIKYIKEKWQFKNRPIVVVMSPQGNVIHPNAYYMISLGLHPRPDSKPPQPQGEDSAGGLLFHSLDNAITTWMKNEKYIFFYGGDDTQWIKQFKEKASALKEVINSIEFFHIKNISEGEDIPWKFWNRIESFFLGWNNIKSFLLSAADMKTGSFTVMSTILKLLSCKTESTGWVLLCKGSKLVDSVHGTIILNVLQKFEQWTPTSPLSEFESDFLKYHSEILSQIHKVCCHIDILEDAAKITEPVICPFCQRRMKMGSRFYCCHSVNLDMNAQH